MLERCVVPISRAPTSTLCASGLEVAKVVKLAEDITQIVMISVQRRERGPAPPFFIGTARWSLSSTVKMSIRALRTEISRAYYDILLNRETIRAVPALLAVAIEMCLPIRRSGGQLEDGLPI